MERLPFAISIPHGGTDIPEEFAPLVVATPDDTKEDIDHLTREICGVPADRVRHLLTFSTSRTFVDLNRPPDSLGPDHPDGVVKRLTHLHRPVFQIFPDPKEVQKVLDRLYHPYHRRLEEIVSDADVKLSLDCHSMSPVGLPVSPDVPGEKRPPICLGHRAGKTASLEMVEALREIMVEVYGLAEEDITIDWPFNGGYITRTHGSRETPMIQIEFNRGFYMRDQCGVPEPLMAPGEVEKWQALFLETLVRLAKRDIFR
jgi:formiminoglutamase